MIRMWIARYRAKIARERAEAYRLLPRGWDVRVQIALDNCAYSREMAAIQ